MSHARRFQPTEHLASEAVVAYSDGELGIRAYQRATAHLVECVECRSAVAEQEQARDRLRDSGQISIPRHLLGALGRIPDCSHSDHQSGAEGRRWPLPWRK